MVENNKKISVSIFRALLYACIITFQLVLILAIVIKFKGLDQKGIEISNTVIKLLSIFLGIITGLKCNQKGFIIGIIIGGLYILTTTLIFGIITKFSDFDFNYIDLIFALIVGAISGIIKVNIQKE